MIINRLDCDKRYILRGTMGEIDAVWSELVDLDERAVRVSSMEDNISVIGTDDLTIAAMVGVKVGERFTDVRS